MTLGQVVIILLGPIISVFLLDESAYTAVHCCHEPPPLPARVFTLNADVNICRLRKTLFGVQLHLEDSAVSLEPCQRRHRRDTARF